MCYPFVSVIIPTYHDWERLSLCLHALSQQTYPDNKFEIIIINNDPYNFCPLVEIPSNSQIISKKKKGSYAARNKGLKLAKGKVIAFTDSDCIPEIDWLEKGVIHLLNTENCGIIAGKIKVFFKDINNPTPVEIYEAITAFPQKKYIEKEHFGATANLFTFKSIFQKVGLFDEELQSGGDREWGEKVFACNYKLIYQEEVVVNHPARYSWREIYEKTIRKTNGIEKIKSKRNYQFYYLLLDIFKDIKPPFSLFFRALLNKKIPTLKEKKSFILVTLFVKYTSLLERLRIKFNFYKK